MESKTLSFPVKQTEIRCKQQEITLSRERERERREIYIFYPALNSIPPKPFARSPWHPHPIHTLILIPTIDTLTLIPLSTPSSPPLHFYPHLPIHALTLHPRPHPPPHPHPPPPSTPSPPHPIHTLTLPPSPALPHPPGLFYIYNNASNEIAEDKAGWNEYLAIERGRRGGGEVLGEGGWGKKGGGVIRGRGWGKKGGVIRGRGVGLKGGGLLGKGGGVEKAKGG